MTGANYMGGKRYDMLVIVCNILADTLLTETLPKQGPRMLLDGQREDIL